jgi:hypothetical protein
MYSSCDTFAGGFPHSEISGSKLICQLPEAYRRLSRPSSPIIAKASTTCSYSLDPITLTSRQSPGKTTKSSQGICQVSHLTRYAVLPISIRLEIEVSFDAIKNSCCRWHGPHQTFTNVQFPPATLIRLYEFLKNSRLITLSRSTTKQPLAKPLWC